MDILVNKLYNGGKIKDKCENAGFYERLTLIEQQFKGAAVLLHKMGHFPDGFRKIWSNERLLNIVEQLIGPNIAGRFNCTYMCIIVHSVCTYRSSSVESSNEDS